MDHETMSEGCPWRITIRGSWYCKALVGQPNKAHCKKSNCAALYIADLLDGELREKHNKLKRVVCAIAPARWSMFLKK